MGTDDKDEIDGEMAEHFDERYEYDPWVDDLVCRNTRLSTDECLCMECRPEIYRFKFLCMECETIDDVVATLEGALAYFKAAREEGYYIDGGIGDDYMEVHPPKREGYYWAKCQVCHRPFLVQKGAMYPKTCDACDLKEGKEE
jgi:hypothetical protein